MNAIGHITTNKSVNSLECEVVGAIWNVDIGLGSLVVELLTRVAGVPGLILGPAIIFHYIYILIPPSPFLLATGKITNWYLHVNYARTVRRRIHVTPIKKQYLKK